MRGEYLREKQEKYHEMLRMHFPPLLEKIIGRKPDALIFVDTSARPFSYLALKLWRNFGAGKPPLMRFVTPVPGWVKTAETAKILAKEVAPSIESHRLLLKKFIERQQWRGKRVVVFDDYVNNGNTVRMLRETLESEGVNVTTAAFSAPAGFVDFAAVNHLIEPYWDQLLTRQVGKLHPPSPNAVQKRGFDFLRTQMSEISDAIIGKRRKK